MFLHIPSPIAEFASPGPIMIEIGSFLSIRWYGFLIASAVLIGVTLSQYLAKRRNVNPELVADLAIWLVVGAIPAARLYYVLFEWKQYVDRPAEIFAIWHGGIAIHGAIIGGLIASLIFARLNKVSFWQLADLVAPSLILGQAIGRWGNFFNSEAFGRPTDLPWKLYIPPAQRPPGYEGFDYFHPTFLYESLWNLGVFAILMTLFFRGLNAARSARAKDNRNTEAGRSPEDSTSESSSNYPAGSRSTWQIKTGTLILVYLIAYSLGRFWIEGLRTDSLMLGPLRIAQVVSLVEIAIGILGLVWLYGLNRKLPDVVKANSEPESKSSPISE